MSFQSRGRQLSSPLSVLLEVESMPINFHFHWQGKQASVCVWGKGGPIIRPGTTAAVG